MWKKGKTYLERPSASIFVANGANSAFIDCNDMFSVILLLFFRRTWMREICRFDPNNSIANMKLVG